MDLKAEQCKSKHELDNNYLNHKLDIDNFNKNKDYRNSGNNNMK